MIMYKGNQEVNVEQVQVSVMKRSGWSTTFLEEKKEEKKVAAAKPKEPQKATPTTATTAKPTLSK